MGIISWKGEEGGVPGVGVFVGESHQQLWRKFWEGRTAVTGGVFAYLQADNDRKDLDVDSEDVNAEKMSRFIRMNELRLVTEYNPVVITSSSQPSPQHSVSSSWASSGPSVYARGCMQGLHSGVDGDGEDTQLFAAAA